MGDRGRATGRRPDNKGTGGRQPRHGGGDLVVIVDRKCSAHAVEQD